MADFSSRGSGDCKAYTLSKDFALRALGMDDDRLRIVLVHLPKRGVDHAVLAVATTKGVMILDSILHLVLPQEKFRSEYLPLFMLNASGRWTFRQDMELARAKLGETQKKLAGARLVLRK